MYMWDYCTAVIFYSGSFMTGKKKFPQRARWKSVGNKSHGPVTVPGTMKKSTERPAISSPRWQDFYPLSFFLFYHSFDFSFCMRVNVTFCNFLDKTQLKCILIYIFQWWHFLTRRLCMGCPVMKYYLRRLRNVLPIIIRWFFFFHNLILNCWTSFFRDLPF
jgi:hypothetical protein